MYTAILTLLFFLIGSSPGMANIEPFNVYPGDATMATVDLLTPLPHGFTVYSTLICINNAGHYTVAYSDGVTILTEPPLSNGAFLLVSSPNLTQFESRDGFLPSSEVSLRWGGFREPSGAPLAYQVRITPEGGVVGNWSNVGHVYSLTLADLPLEVNATHLVEVRAVNLAGLPSNSLMENITIVDTLPYVESGTRLQ